jgi:hypothetical protein
MVFVVNVERLKDANVGVPSLIRLHSLDREAVKREGGSKFYSLHERGFKLMPRLADRELGVQLASDKSPS